MNHKIQVFDNVLSNPFDYRALALAATYSTVAVNGKEFHGISRSVDTETILPTWITTKFPSLQSSLTFFRKSPADQVEPNFIHSDADMGDWTAILYLNEFPPAGDGTSFWKYKSSGAIEVQPGVDVSNEWTHIDKWERWHFVQAAFNRLLIFPSVYFHSRGMFSNYGEGDGARMIQVVFGTGDIGGSS